MSIISKHKTLCGIAAAFAFLACQGPWEYWPEDPANYKGIWIYAHIVSGRPVSDVCLEKLLELDETYIPAFAFFEKADISVNGTFNGKEQTVALTQNPKKPNCFDGPENLLAEKGGAYKLDASVDWDSSGSFVTSRFTAETKIPEKFKILHAIAPSPAVSGNPLSNPKTYERYDKNGSVYYLTPPNDILAHYFIPEYSSDVGGALATMIYDGENVSWGENVTDFMFGQGPDTSSKATFGNQHRIDYIWNQQVAGINNAIDSMPILNLFFPIGDNIKFLFYATGKEYGDYIETDIYSSEDSRIKARYNINGGAGIFAGMLVDTFTVNIKALPGEEDRTYPNLKARAYRCGSVGREETRPRWETRKECRLYLQEFCEKEYLYFTPNKIDITCHPVVVVKALNEELPWDYYLYKSYPDTLLYRIPKEDFPQIQQDGERFYCLGNNYKNQLCENERKAALESKISTPSMEALWIWCSDRDWPIESSPQCGTALVSWVRLGGQKSNVLEREANKWCVANPSDPQCVYRN